MTRINWIAFAAVAAITGVDVDQASAQIPIGGPGPLPQNRPAFSPYLNLLRRGNSPTLNYFGIVRPEINANNAIGELRQQSTDEMRSINQLQNQSADLPTTGHAATFQNLGGYFMRMSSGGSVGGGTMGGVSRGGSMPSVGQSAPGR